METSANHRQLLREYLLGRLNVPEYERRRELAESYFEDDARYEEFTAVENDLLDQYVLGRLSDEDRAGFESYLAHLPKNMAREKLSIVQALARTAAESGRNHQPETGLLGAGAMTAAASPEASSWQQPYFPPGFLKPLMSRYSLAAAMLLAGVVLAWLLFYTQRLQQTNKQLQAGLDQGTRERLESQDAIQNLQQQSADERKRLLAELGRAREKNEAQARRLAKLQSTAPPASPILYGADERRGRRGGEGPSLDRVRLKAGAPSLRLNLQLPQGETYQLIEARLTETGAQKEVWTFVCEPACTPAIANRILILQLPAGHLAPGRHRLSLLLRAADGLIMPKGYDFMLVKQ